MCLAYLHSTEHDGRIVVLELGHDALANVFALLLIFRLVPGQSRQYCYSAPFRALIQRHEEF